MSGFGNNTYPQRIRRRSNLGHIFREKKVRLMGPGNTVLSVTVLKFRHNTFIGRFGSAAETLSFLRHYAVLTGKQ
jgi:hypothetical protein